MGRLSVLLVGDMRRAEFRPAREQLADLAELTERPDVKAAERWLTDAAMAPGLIVLAQAFPGEFTHQAIDRLRTAAPLARMLGLLGPWCEGEARTGRPWPGTVRVYWHQWQAGAAREIARLERGLAASWVLPPTAADEDRYLALSREPLPRLEGPVAIVTARAEMHDWLAAVCRRQGAATVWLRFGERARLEGTRSILFDATDCTGAEAEALRLAVEWYAPAPALALVDFPRPEDGRRARAAGAAAVLSKPVLIDDLCGEMRRLQDTARTCRGTPRN